MLYNACGMLSPVGRSMTPEAELSIMERRQHGPSQSDRCGGTLWRGSSDSTMTRICRATGETLLAPSRNRRSRDRYNPRHREIGERREGDGWVRSSGENRVMSVEQRDPAVCDGSNNMGGKGEMT